MTIEATLNRQQGAMTTLNNGKHVWNAEVGKTLGSNDVAPDPHDLFDSALAACTALTLELYLRRQKWPVSSIYVKVDHVETRDSEGRVDYQMQREISVNGDLTDEQRSRLLEIAGKCPIHRILEGHISVSSRLI